MHAHLLPTSVQAKQLSDYLVKHIQLASGEEGLQPVEWGAYLLVASKESEVQLLNITTCICTRPLVQTHKHVASV